jgi:hypothetical protein
MRCKLKFILKHPLIIYYIKLTENILYIVLDLLTCLNRAQQIIIN